MKKGGANRFKLPPEAVAEKLVHAVESRSPRPNYYVTTPTHIMGLVRRILPRRQLDWFLATASDKEVK